MTLVSALVAPSLTPLITWVFASHQVEIHVLAMMGTVPAIVALPSILGLLARRIGGSVVISLEKGLPIFSILLILWIIGIGIALNQERILAFLGAIILGVVFHNLLGLVIGYALARRLTKDSADCPYNSNRDRYTEFRVGVGACLKIHTRTHHELCFWKS